MAKLKEELNWEKEKRISVDPISVREINLPPIIVAPMIQPPSPPRAKPPLISFSLNNSPLFSLWPGKKFRNDAGKIDSVSRRKSSAVHPNRPEFETRLRRSKSEGRSSRSDELEFVENKDELKCGGICLCIPRFGKGKSAARERNPAAEELESEADRIMFRTVSMEKFDCGSSAMNSHENEDWDSTRFYYDLPLELVKAGLNEVNSPVLAAFVFEKELKGALKRGSTARAAVHRKSQECSSARNVRFSSSFSSPSSASSLSSPARKEFNAFLDAEARA